MTVPDLTPDHPAVEAAARAVLGGEHHDRP